MLKNIIAIIFVCLILTIGCGCHKCDNCLHGGSCSDNTCSCPDPYSGNNCDTMCTLGYEGYHCSTLSKTKFFGTWNCTSSDPAGNNQTYQITFTDDGVFPEGMYLSNFNNKGYKVLCTLTGKYKFDINSQTSIGSLHANVSGNAILRGTTLTLYITEDGVSFFGTATPQ